MGNRTCELCEHEVELGAIEKHHVVPREVREQAGIKRSKIVRLCSNCRQELNRWNSTKVAEMAYDAKMKRFRAKSPLEMAKEYEFTYRVFSQYKKEQLKRDKAFQNNC